MKLTISQLFAQVTRFWKAQNKKSKKTIIIIAASLMLLAIVLTIFINSSGYVVLYSNLSSSEMGEIASRLNEMGIDFKTKTDGSILVPKENEAELQMTLTSEGYPQSTISYDIFSNNSGFMTTDYEKKKYLLFQLQNRLQDAIKTIVGINSAIVTISLPEEDSFVLQEESVPATASVVLDLDSAFELSSKQVKGIEALVSKSVPGLESKNVAIVSNTGEMINNQYENESETGTYTRLELEKNISSDIENKISKLMTPIFGLNNIRIAVNTQVDINKKVSEQTTYIPVIEESGIISTQDSSKEVISSDNSSGGIPGTEGNSGVTTYADSGNTGESGNYSESNSVNYLNNQLIEQIEREGYEIKDITVSVLIGNGGLSETDLDQYNQMVAFAAGISTEKVSITDAKFLTLDQPIAVSEPTGFFNMIDHKYPNDWRWCGLIIYSFNSFILHN